MLSLNSKRCKNKILEMRRGIRAFRGVGFAKDIIVESESEFMGNLKDENKIENEIYNRGYLLYENAN